MAIRDTLEHLQLELSKISQIARDDRQHKDVESSCDLLQNFREVNDQLQGIAKEFNGTHKWLKEEKVPQVFGAYNVTSITIGGYRFTVSATLRARMLDKEAGMEWLRNNDLGDLITETVNAQTLSSAAGAEEEAGRELPEEYFNIFRQPNTSITKAK